MRIDYIVDTYSRNYPSRPDTNDRKKQIETPTQKPVEKVQDTETKAHIPSDPIKQSNTDDIKIAKSFVSEDADKVLSTKEKKMLAQLFPPGLFGAGIRAYQKYSSEAETVQKLGNRIDVRQ